MTSPRNLTFRHRVVGSVILAMIGFGVICTAVWAISEAVEHFTP
jgi:Na+/phosphate symporter